VFGIPDPRMTNESRETLAVPAPDKTAPGPTELAQPAPTAPTFPHGQAVALPSPKQKLATGVAPPSSHAIALRQKTWWLAENVEDRRSS
jgi:hypothetical protein